MHIVVTMITKDRSESGRENYFAATLDSLRESGMFESRVSFEMHLFDGGSKSLDFLCPWDTRVHGIHLAPDFSMRPNVNAGRALVYGGNVTRADWVLFLEDDIEVCKNFLPGIEHWLQESCRANRRVYTFYTPYKEIHTCYLDGGIHTFDYPVKKFYGTQAFAIRPDDAVSMGQFLIDLPYGTGGYDMEMKKWHIKEYGDDGFFLASVPCFVQHMGTQSLLFDDGRFHQCGGYQGKDWDAMGVKEVDK